MKSSAISVGRATSPWLSRILDRTGTSRRSLTISRCVCLSSAASTRTKPVSPASSSRLGSFTKDQSATGSRTKAIEDLVVPVTVSAPVSSSDGTDISVDFADRIDKGDIAMVLTEFCRRPETRTLSQEHGINHKLFMDAFRSFRTYCLSAGAQLEPELQVIFSDMLKGGGQSTDIFPYFLQHARKVFPHLDCLDDLRSISDLTRPYLWYPEARAIQRKIIFHAGPTNSGKTYKALQRYYEAKSGIYCGPLKLLANEVFHKSNFNNVPCDLVTGEERRYAVDNENPSSHLSATVEMLSTSMRVEVAIIDEIQMLRDPQRGHAWTRALLGVAADEVHVCGELAAIPIVKELVEPLGESVEVNIYDRISPLEVMNHGIGTLEKIEKGDCIVCFSKKSIYTVSRQLEKLGIKAAVIYGDLPPGTKLAQAAKFNNPDDDTDVLVATDAIGMGINLSIKRVIFYSLDKVVELPTGERTMGEVPTHQALQIAGRAGRFGTEYEQGRVTTRLQKDIGKLKEILERPVEAIQTVGIAPSFEQLEMFAYHLPNASLSNLLDIFASLCSIDSTKFFMCTIEQTKALADLIEHVKLPLKVRYTFCLAPVTYDSPIIAANFVKFARKFSTGQPLTFSWLNDNLGWPPKTPETLSELIALEQTYEVLDIYLWLGIRFQDMFLDMEVVREMQRELDRMIEVGITNINELIRRSEGGAFVQTPDSDVLKKESRSVPKSVVDDQAAKLAFSKRRGKRKSVVSEAMASGLLSQEQLDAIKEELRREMLADSSSNKDT
uniref:ATP-dependent RNA helicase SUV3 homolog, mitochondrial n=1 Tax=Plectus sambesii TaxID=2011161 RepID=A0A914V392_9BILA